MNSEYGENNREFTRVSIKIAAVLRFDGKTVDAINVQDLSMKGIFVQTEESMQEGTVCQITLSLAGQSDPLELNMKGVIQRITDAGMGIKFTEIDLESYSHLKNLIMLNTDASNVDSVEKEIGEHIGLNKRD